MKLHASVRLALSATVVLLAHAAFAGKPPPPPPPPPPSSGTLVLDFSYPGGDFTENWGLTVAPSGTIYASGYANGGGWRGLVLASSDSGSSWLVSDDFAPTGRSVYYWDFGGGIASDAAGNVYVTGSAYDDDGLEPNQWYVRRSSDSGATWTIVDAFASGTSACCEDVSAITVDGAGDVYVGGLAHDPSWQYLWTIRKGIAGTSWSTVDVLPTSYPNYPMALFAHPTTGVFAIGKKTVAIKGNTSTSIVAWLVRRSTNGGATWSDVDTFQLSTGQSTHANGIGADALGNLYVVGRGITTSRGNNIYHWLVRKSADGGNSWSTVDDFVPSSNSAEARRFVATSNGDLYVAGISSTSTGTHWIVRKNPGGTGAWSTIDDYQYAAGKTTEPHAIATDAAGNLFVGGGGWDNTGTSYLWLIKKY